MASTVQENGAWSNPGGAMDPTDKVGAILASAATITPTHPIHHISGTTEITKITLPWERFVGKLTLIPDAAFTLATGGTGPGAIGKAATAVAGKAMDLYYDGALWYPSYTS